MEEITLTELEKKYINRPIEEEHLTLEVFEKIENLRKISERESEDKKEDINKASSYKVLEKGDRVNFTYNFDNRTYSFVGTIIDIKGKGRYGQKFDIENQIGTFRRLTRLENRIHFRAILNYSHIKVPKELKEVPTKKLLHAFRHARKSEYRVYGYYDSWYCGLEHGVNDDLSDISVHKFNVNGKVNATIDEMRAELSTREHVLSKFEKKIQKHLKNYD